MRVDVVVRMVVRVAVMVDEGWKRPRIRWEGKGDVRKMHGGVGKTEEVDERLGRGELSGGGWNVVAGETFQNRLYPVRRNISRVKACWQD